MSRHLFSPMLLIRPARRGWGLARRRWPGQVAGRVAAVTAGALVAGVLAAVPASAAPVPARRVVPSVPTQKPVPTHVIHGKHAKAPEMRSWRAPATTWPAGTATVSLPAVSRTAGTPEAGPRAPGGAAVPGPGSVRAGGLPVWVNWVAGATMPGTAGGERAAAGVTMPQKVRVSVASHRAASAAGIHGLVFTAGRASGSATGGATATMLHVSVDYSSFEYAYGGDYASRLRLVELPACALTTPRVAACRRQTPLDSADNVKATSLGADVALPAGAGTGAVVLAATSSPSGSGGDFTATSLSEAGTWSAGGESGAFTYSYPITVPPVPGGLEPDVSLGYNSQMVDGLTSSTNGQASWIGDGWDYSPGYVERDYQSCEQNSGSDKTGDFCYSSDDETTLSLNGQDTALVRDSSTGAWHPEDDNGEKVTYETTGSNGTYDGGYWVITQTDGTSYYFGLDELPGYASGDATTNSVWALPVYSASSGQPCYNATFSESHCTMAWRWNLDYVTDPHGDAIAYFYKDETNYYASDNGTTASAAYQQGGAPSKIEYGLRAGSIYGATPAAQVTFTTATDRTDTPSDLSCSSGSSCDTISPTFWTNYRLTTITTQALEGSSLDTVDSWALGQSYPSTGDTTTPPSLWLDSITRTGEDGGPVSLPPVNFGGTPMPNRVETPTDTSDGYSLITRLRLTSVTNETGGQLSIGYAAPGGACTSGNFPAPDANTLPCYPDYWSPPGTGSPVLDWFNKYAIAYVTQTDTTGAGEPVVTSYSYSGAAWHYDDDALTRSSQRTWDQWRGYRTVTTETGTSPDPVTKTVDTYLQGMDGDYQSDGSTSSVTVTDSRGDAVTDHDQYAGTDLESIVYDGTSGGEVTDTITLPWSSAATATQTQPSPLPALRSFLTGTAETKVYTALAGGGTRESDTTYTHDSYGQVISASSVPDTTDASQDTCTTTTYAYNTSAWILDLPSEVTDVSVPCTTTPSLPADAISDKITLYDGATSVSSDTPTEGNVTQTELATSYSGSAPTYTTESAATYDEYGRVRTSTDADGRTTTTSYTPATGAEPTQDVVTDPKGLVTTTTYDPARDLPLTTTSPAGLVTTEAYDALGRLTAVWTPGNATTGPANYKYSYTVRDSGPSYTTTSALAPDGSDYLQDVTIYDSLGRTRETQQEMPGGGWDVTDTVYNSVGEQTLTAGPYYAGSITAGTIVGQAEDEVADEDGRAYDGDGRVIKDVAYDDGTETWETDTAYGGNYTTTSYACASSEPECGGTAQTTFTDGRGLTTAIYQYHASAPADPSDPASDYDRTTYTYWPSQRLETITDTVGNQWKYAYNLAGDQTSQTDPDSGTTTSTYDAAGQLMTATDARGKTISYVYDADGRKTAEYDTTGGASETGSDEIASWTYDTLAKGMLTSSSSYYNGQAYTEEVTGYNAYGEPKGTDVVIPSGQGKLAGTYLTEDTTYAPTGQLETYEDSPAGGLPTETVSYTYNTAGQPTSVDGTWAYVNSLTYTETGQPQEYTMGSSSEPAYVLDSYSPQTQQLTEQQTETGVTPSDVDDITYRYDNIGGILSENDTPADGPAQAQCFQYDYLGRLVQAWSQGTACTASSTPSTSAESGAAAPYWDTYTYNTIGNLTAQTSAATSGTVTTTAETYPAAGSAQPHAPAAEQVSGGSAGITSYSYNADGDLTSESGSQSESLDWDDAGRLSSITSPSTASSPTASYFYDADSNLLIEQDPGQATLFLPDEEIILNTSSDTLSGTRYYSIGGQTAAARTSSGSVDYLVGDQQGTASLAIDSATLDVTRRYYDPYGNQLGTAPSSWPGDQGFVGGTASTATGLTNLGAREYNPASARFISPDSLLNPDDPQDLNAYAYAADNPSTESDPSGQYPAYNTGSGTCVGSAQYCAGHSGGGGGSSSNRGRSGGTGAGSDSGSASSGGGGGTPSVGVCATDPEICGPDNLNPSGPPPVGECATNPEICGPDALEPNGPGAHAADHKDTNGSVGSDSTCPQGETKSYYEFGVCIPSTSGAAENQVKQQALRAGNALQNLKHLALSVGDTIEGIVYPFDYSNFCVGWGHGVAYSGCLTVTRDFSIYGSEGVGYGEGPSFSVTGGKIVGFPVTNSDVDSFVVGPSLSVSGIESPSDISGGATWGNEGKCCNGDFAIEGGYSTPGISVIQSSTNLLWRP